MRSPILLCVVVVLAFIGCGEESIDRSTLPTSPPSTPVFIATATPTVIPPLSDVEVKQALITLGDLPSTWYNADTRLPARSDSERCDRPNPFNTNQPIADATETFAKSQNGPWIAETLYQLETTEHASSLMEDMRQTFNCGTWTQIVEPEPTPTLDPAATPEPAATAAADVTPTAPPSEITWDVAVPKDLEVHASAFITRLISDTALPIEYELVFVQRNNLVLLVSHWAYEGVSNDITMSIVERSLEKLDATFAK